ncbi:PP2C family protein-serine/threonine phosphatase [Kocuria sp. U4B]
MTVDAGTPEEAARVRALHALNVLDTPKEERYDRVVRIAQQVFGVKAAAVNLIDADRQFTKAETGLDGLVHAARTDSLCARTVDQDAPLIVPDAVVEARFAGSAFIAGPDPVRFYAGHPLHAPGGEPVGSLCLVDDRPRELDARERRLLAEMAGWVERELAAQDEMDRAAQVHRLIMPQSTPRLDGYELAGRCTPTRDLGGDFYDWFPLGDQLQVNVADVMGKGVPAALLASSARTALRGASGFLGLPEAVDEAAATIAPVLEEAGAFVTAICVRLDPGTGGLRCVDAGHGLGAIYRPDGGYRRLRYSGPPIGVLPGLRWEAHDDVLAPGETLVVVSDGFLDYFSDDTVAIRAAAQLMADTADPQEFVDRATAFALERGLEDDVTVVALHRRP